MPFYLKKNSMIAVLFFSAGLIFFVVSNSVGARKPPKIIFSHGQHAAVLGIECETCHPKAAESTLGTDNLLPGKSECLECHDAEACEKFNCDTDIPGVLEPVTDYSPKFSHAVHLKKEIGCERCHEGISLSDSAATEHLPPMAPCMVCHDGTTADKSCIVCHEDPKGKIPADHRPKSWMVEHVAQVLMDNGASCMMCHDNKSCQQCHKGDYLIPL